MECQNKASLAAMCSAQLGKCLYNYISNFILVWSNVEFKNLQTSVRCRDAYKKAMSKWKYLRYFYCRYESKCMKESWQPFPKVKLKFAIYKRKRGKKACSDIFVCALCLIVKKVTTRKRKTMRNTGSFWIGVLECVYSVGSRKALRDLRLEICFLTGVDRRPRRRDHLEVVRHGLAGREVAVGRYSPVVVASLRLGLIQVGFPGGMFVECGQRRGTKLAKGWRLGRYTK